MKNFECRKGCSTTLQSENTPNGGTCPKGGSHNWSDLGRVGMNNYECRKGCGAHLKSESTPNGGTCPKGGSHNWSKL